MFGTVPGVTDVATVTPTSDLAQAKADLAAVGYCLLEGVVPPDLVARLRDRLAALAAAEVDAGTDYVYEDGANQRVWSLLNKGDEFADVALDPTVTALMNHLLGFGFLLSNLDANIAGPGGKPMFLHADQSFAPPPWPPWPMVANAIWMLDDFTAENGATRVRPGSHLNNEGPVPTLDDGLTTPVTGPAGTVMVFDGRLWHQTGANVTDGQHRHGILAYYCRPFVRTQENWFLSIDPAVLERRPELKALLGYEQYLSLGMVDGMPRVGPRF
jgi:ectoine hydroxylase-related dioxygenase (phytanoyl-CoA dioxygenase family)